MRTTAAVSLPEDYFKALAACATKHNVTISIYLRGIIADALFEEGYRFGIQRSRAQASPSSGEAGKANGAAAS